METITVENLTNEEITLLFESEKTETDFLD